MIIKRINQSAIDDESLLFGSITQNGDFKDGLLINTLRKACRVGGYDLFLPYFIALLLLLLLYLLMYEN